MIQRETQTAGYWEEEFAVTERDVARAYDLILDRGEPVALADLAKKVIEWRCRAEEASLEEELDKGPAYQPKETYDIGQQILFPALGFVLGTVTGVREANSPDYGAFVAIEVELEGEEDTKEFASQLVGDHRLNRAGGLEELLVAGQLLSTDELHNRHGSVVEEELSITLEEHPDFVRFEDQWFLKGLLVDVGRGQLNIAEALIEIKAMPLQTTDILPDLDLPAEVPAEIKLLSLNRALDADERFNNVGDLGREVWYLRRLTPGPVVKPPERLVAHVQPYDRRVIRDELLLIEREIEDEASQQPADRASRPLFRTSFTLSYPHWRHGTLPLTARTSGLFASAAVPHSPIVLVDGQSGDRMQGWVVHGSSYVYGLAGWYERHQLPAGALIKLERTRDPRFVTVDYEPSRLKSQWIPFAAVKAGQLSFQMRKVPISCEFDESMALGEDNRQALDDLWSRTQRSAPGLYHLMVQILPELVPLSPQGTVHAKAIYSAVNVLYRTPPGPVFAQLSTEPCFVAMGGGYWSFDKALVSPRGG